MIDPQDLESFRVGWISWSVFSNKRELLDTDYLEFATRDLADGQDKRRVINAVSNAKRALHLCVDYLVESLGGYSGACKPTSSFPQKINFCRRCGIASPRIVEKINHLRNKLEHEYYVPNQSEAEDFVDIVTLFLDSNRTLTRRVPEHVELFSPQEFFRISKSWVSLKYEIGSGRITGSWSWLDCTENQIQEVVEILNVKQQGAKNSRPRSQSHIALDRLYRQASADFWKNEEFAFSVRDGDSHFQWMRLLLASGHKL